MVAGVALAACSVREGTVPRPVRRIARPMMGTIVEVLWRESPEDKDRAAVRRVSTIQVAQTLNIALNGLDGGLVHMDEQAEPVPINLRLPLADRS